MNMSILDWSIVGGLFLSVLLIAVYTKRYTRGVADFLSASRCAGRYMLTMAEGLSCLSAVAFVAIFEQYYCAGFGGMWWAQILAPVFLIIGISGWVSYRFRETRAMTMPQFFEIRYSRRFRIFTGLICWVSGMINYGIFPGVTARLLINFCGLPASFTFMEITIPTLPVVMFIMLSVAVTLTLSGGQIAVMVTDFIQSQYANVVMLIMIGFLFWRFSWSDITTGLKNAPEGKSMLNPYNQSDLADFNLWFFLMMAFIQFYIFMAWQGSQGYFSAAKSPHEAKMGRILAGWRGFTQTLLLLLIPVTIYAVFHHPQYAEDVQAIRQAIETIPSQQEQVQMRVPLALAHFLPVGLMGLFTTLLISAAISTDDTYLHSWASIFIQDVLLPFRKKPLSPEQHLKWLRLSVVGMACIAFVWSLLFPIKEYIFMYWQITGAIFTGGAGAVIIFGLYWKRGTTAAAWVTMSAGTTVALSAILLRTVWGHVPFLLELAPEFPLNGMQMAFSNALLCITLYVLVSLITCKKPFNMNRMLHRGKYAIQGEHVTVKKASLFSRLLGLGKEFTRRDEIIAIAIIVQTLLWVIALIAGTIINMLCEVSDDAWAQWWFGVIIYLGIMAVVTVVWFTIGGIGNIIEMFRSLAKVKRNALDDGAVTDHHNLADESLNNVLYDDCEIKSKN